MILLTVTLYDIIAVIVTVAALFCASQDYMPGLVVCGIVSGVAMVAMGWVLATEE